MARTGSNGEGNNPGGKGTAYHAQYVTVELTCHHKLEFPTTHAPSDDEILWCKHCREYKPLTRVNEYAAKCDDCRYGRRYGTAKLSALTKATAHALKNRHTVTVTLGDETVEVISPKVTEETLPGTGSDAPF